MKNLTKRLLAGLLVAFLVVAQVSTIPDVAVMGGTNLTTVGAIPYVSSSGTLSQDSALFWNSTSDLLYVGYTNSSTYGVRLGPAGSELSFRNGLASVVHSGTVLTWNTSQSAYQWNDNGFTSLFYLKASSTPSVGVGPGNTSPTGTLYVYDATATTGSTLLTVARGAAQTAASTVLDLNGVVKFGGTNTTGAGSALLGANSPAVTNTAPYTWIRAVSSDGSTVFIPAWK